MTGSCSRSRRRLGAWELAHLILCTGALLLAAAPAARAQEVESFYSAVSSNADLSTLQAAIEAAGLVEALSEPTLAYTVFAPTNVAFEGLLQALQISAEELLAQPRETLQSLILYHALDTVVLSDNVPTEPTAVPTLAGPSAGPLTVQRNGSSVTVTARGSTANVVAADVGTGAGVVHVVDAVLLPFYTTLAQAVISNPELSFLEALLESTFNTEMLANPTLTHTLLAPSDAAFNRSLADLNIDSKLLLEDSRLAMSVLYNHVLEERWLSKDIPTEPTTVKTFNVGRTLTAQATSSGVTFWSKDMNTTVVEADIPIGLGPKSVVHVVDMALLPYYRTVLNVAAARTDLGIFVKAVVAEGTYVSVATGETPFNGTIFAPTDDAFVALLSTLGLSAEELLADRDTLKRVLETHIVSGVALTYDDLYDNLVPLTAINDQPLTAEWTFELENPLVRSLASRAFVVDQDGTPRISVMVINNVLLPGTQSSPPAPRAQEDESFYSAVISNADLSTLQAAIEAAGLVEALSEPTLAYTVFAPTNVAFEGLLQALQISAEELLAQPRETLQSLILYHALDTVVLSDNVPTEPTAVPTLADPSAGPLTVQRNGSSVTVTARGSTANVVAADVGTGAGVVHVVDAVLLPFYTTLAQAVISNPELSFLEALLESTFNTEMLANPTLTHTLLAPSDAAFNRSLADLNIDSKLLLEDSRLAMSVLYNHVLEERWLSKDIPTEPTTVKTFNVGRTLTAQATSSGVTFWSKDMTTTVVEADIPIGLGPKSVVHVVDMALLPYYRTVLDVIAARTDLGIFHEAVLAEGTYVSVATGETPFDGTIFAPTDDAFVALLSALGLSAEELLADRDTLKRVLETHIVSGVALTYDDLYDNLVPLTAINDQPLTAEWTFELENPLVRSLASRAFVVDQDGTPRISVMVINNVLLPGTPSSPPAYGGYGGYGYGGYGPYGYGPAPTPYGGYGRY